MRRLGKKMLILYVGYLLFVFSVLTAMAEFVLLPALMGLPRDTILMGFAGTPHAMVDDTYINGMGFAGDELHMPKPPHTMRMLTLGGSAFFNRRMAERLKAGLQESLVDEMVDRSISTKRIEVLGGALRTHTTMSSILKYKVLSKYDFDYVLIYHGINDLWINEWSDYGRMGPWYDRNVLLDHSIIARLIYNEARNRLASVSQFWDGGDAGVAGKLPADEATEDSVPSAEVFKENMTHLVTMIRESGSVPVLMTFAWLILPENFEDGQDAEALGYNNPQNYDRMKVELWGTPERVRKGLTEHNQIVREIATEFDVPLIDQEMLMGKDPLLYGDVCHLSETGTRRFIRHISEYFRENGLFYAVPWHRLERIRGGLVSYDWFGGVRCTEENQPIRVSASAERPVILNGWAVDRDAHDVARDVYVAVDDDVVAYAEYGGSRPDVADHFQNEKYEHSGWRAYLRPQVLPCGLHKVSLRIISKDGMSLYVTERKVAVKVADCRQQPGAAASNVSLE